MVNRSNQSPMFRGLRGIDRILELDGYHVWGTSPIRDDEGKVHLLFSRWTEEASHYGWVMCCEVAHAVSDHPEGPFEVTGTVFKGRGGTAWDSWSIHNPTVHRIGDKFVLFYMGSDGSSFDKSQDDLIELSQKDSDAYAPYFHNLVASKQVGMAVADNPAGPWTRVGDHPVVPRGKPGEWDDFVTSNPAFLTHPNEELWLYYKGWSRETAAVKNGNRQYGLAIGHSLGEPFRKYLGNPLIDLSHLGNNIQCEDAYLFHSKGKNHMVLRDMGYYNHEVGLHFESADGLHWGMPQIAFREASYYFDEPLPGLDREGRLERPQILLNEDRPEYLYTAYVGGSAGTSSAAVLKFD